MTCTFGNYCNQEKEHIKAALNGKVIIYGKNGEKLLVPATKEMCDDVILQTYDRAVFQALDSMTHGRVLNQILEKHGIKSSEILLEYMTELFKENKKYNDYIPEFIDDLDEEDAKTDLGDRCGIKG